MVDFEQARRTMVDSQLRTNGVIDRAIIAAMGRVPRELFVPETRRSVAYIDDVHDFREVAPGRSMPAPAPFARLLQLAEIGSTDRVLDVGATTGYGAAVIGELAREVVAIERNATLVEAARSHLRSLGMGNVTVIESAHTAAPEGPFDVILLEGAVDAVPEGLVGVLAEGGRLVCLIRSGMVAVAHVFVNSGGSVTGRAEFNASLPPLDVMAAEETFAF